MAADLAQLQDRLPAFPGAEARRVIAKQLGRPVEENFSSFDDEPIAAASIAQVHFAETSDGKAVAIKVLRPGIEAAFERDLDLFRWLARLLERTQPALRRLRPVDVVETFAETVRAEMDLRLEAAAASELAENTAQDDGFRVPAVDWRRTSARVLTTERAEGIPIADREALAAAGHDLSQLATRVLRSFLRQAMGDGFFHADLHQGNLFVDTSGVLIAVDFGIMGRLNEATRRAFARIVLGFIRADYRAVAQVHFDAGYVPRGKSLEAFAQAIRSVGEPILDQPASEISIARLLAQLFAITETFDMRTQPQLLLLQKTMVVAEGVARDLDEQANIWEIAQPVVEAALKETLSPEAQVRKALEDGLDMARRLPGLMAKVENAADMIVDGRVRIYGPTPSPARPQAAAGGSGFAVLVVLGLVAAGLLMAVL